MMRNNDDQRDTHETLSSQSNLHRRMDITLNTERQNQVPVIKPVAVQSTGSLFFSQLLLEPVKSDWSHLMETNGSLC